MDSSAVNAARQHSAIMLFAVSIPLHIVIIGLLVRMMMYFVWLSDNAVELYGW